MTDPEPYVSKPVYGNWHIEYAPPPIPSNQFDYCFWHKDYDGPEDTRCGHACSVDEAKQLIDEIEDDGPDELLLIRASELRRLKQGCGCTLPEDGDRAGIIVCPACKRRGETVPTSTMCDNHPEVPATLVSSSGVGCDDCSAPNLAKRIYDQDEPRFDR